MSRQSTCKFEPLIYRCLRRIDKSDRDLGFLGCNERYT